MSARTSASQLSQSVKELLVEWDRTLSEWRDAKSREFQESYLAELPIHVARTAAAMEEIDDVLRKVRKDCE